MEWKIKFPMKSHHYKLVDVPLEGTGRLEAFSDGIMAVFACGGERFAKTCKVDSLIRSAVR